MTAEKRDDNLVPRASSVVTIATMMHRAPVEFQRTELHRPPAKPNTSPRYVDQLLATVAAPTANSSTRSQPMIHATSSPKLA